MFSVQNLSVRVDESEKLLLHDMFLSCNPGSVHAIMGPNGSGKSTFTHAVLGNPAYKIQADSLTFHENNLTDLPVHKRAQLGIFVSFQNPYVLPGMQVFRFLKETYTAFTGKSIELAAFTQRLHQLLPLLGMQESFLTRNVNEGFSGGEKKRLEMLQLLLFQPQLVILDEIDSGLDVDGLKMIAQALMQFKEENPQAIIILITHYCRILEYITPDYVHILKGGTIVHSGTSDLAKTIEERGYDSF